MIVIRFANSPGVMMHQGGVVCRVIEPPWRNNETNMSCIPPGDYTVEYLLKSASGKYRDCYHVAGVPGRSGILIHLGNTADDTTGCILPGMKCGTLWGEEAVLNSAQAMSRIHELTGRKNFKLSIRSILNAA